MCFIIPFYYNFGLAYHAHVMDALAVDKWLNQPTDSHVHVNRATEINVGLAWFISYECYLL
jgi:hypothetical protein